MIFLGADHGGYEYKEQLKSCLTKLGYEWEDKGNLELDKNDDYPVFAKAVALAVAQAPDEHKGILLCRTGSGVTTVANKFKGVRAALAINSEQLTKTRGDEDINVLTVASDYVTLEELKQLVKTFLETKFSQEARHARRLQEMDEIESANFK